VKSYVRNTINLSCAKMLLTSVIGMNTTQKEISDLLRITESRVGESLSFCTERPICKKEGNCRPVRTVKLCKESNKFTALFLLQ